MNVIELTKIHKTYGEGENRTQVLQNVNVSIAQGEFVAIMGPSGSGKSTLMNIIGLLDIPSQGGYRIDGRDVTGLSDATLAHLRRDKIGFIFQSFNLLGRLSVAQNVELPMIYRGLSSKERRERAAKLLKQVGLEGRTKYRPNQISGGQAQRVAIARALANEPSIILADEPTGNLDTKSSQAIMDILRSLHQAGNTIIMVTHNPELSNYADRVIHIRDGQMVIEGDGL